MKSLGGGQEKEKAKEQPVVTEQTLSLMANRVMSDGENLYNTQLLMKIAR